MERLDNLIVTVVGDNADAKIPYSKIKEICERNKTSYKEYGQVPSIHRQLT